MEEKNWVTLIKYGVRLVWEKFIYFYQSSIWWKWVQMYRNSNIELKEMCTLRLTQVNIISIELNNCIQKDFDGFSQTHANKTAVRHTLLIFCLKESKSTSEQFWLNTKQKVEVLKKKKGQEKKKNSNLALLPVNVSTSFQCKSYDASRKKKGKAYMEDNMSPFYWFLVIYKALKE